MQEAAQQPISFERSSSIADWSTLPLGERVSKVIWQFDHDRLPNPRTRVHRVGPSPLVRDPRPDRAFPSRTPSVQLS